MIRFAKDSSILTSDVRVERKAMHAKLLLSTTVDALFLAELRLFEHEVVSDQEVDVVCSPTTACMLLVESDLVNEKRRKKKSVAS